MPKLMSCKLCGEEFDLLSPEKKAAGGLICYCPDHSEETTTKYAGVQAADGKQSQATILKFESEEDKNNYIRYWKNTSGYHKGKSCQLSQSAMTTPAIHFQTIVKHLPTNHKGKAE